MSIQSLPFCNTLNSKYFVNTFAFPNSIPFLFYSKYKNEIFPKEDNFIEIKRKRTGMKLELYFA